MHLLIHPLLTVKMFLVSRHFSGLTKKSYVDTIIKAIQQCKEEEVDIDVR